MASYEQINEISKSLEASSATFIATAEQINKIRDSFLRIAPKFSCAYCKKTYNAPQKVIAPRRDHKEGIVAWCVTCTIKESGLTTWEYSPLYQL